jgi:hypothetical protein
MLVSLCLPSRCCITLQKRYNGEQRRREALLRCQRKVKVPMYLGFLQRWDSKVLCEGDKILAIECAVFLHRFAAPRLYSSKANYAVFISTCELKNSTYVTECNRVLSRIVFAVFSILCQVPIPHVIIQGFLHGAPSTLGSSSSWSVRAEWILKSMTCRLYKQNDTIRPACSILISRCTTHLFARRTRDAMEA